MTEKRSSGEFIGLALSSLFHASSSSNMFKPPRVWRVEPYARTELTSRGEPHFASEEDFQLQRMRHFNWKDHTFLSPFLSTFSAKSHAVQWGKRRTVYGDAARYPGAVIYEIDTRDLQLYRGLQDDEHLIVGVIPASNIRSRTSLHSEYNRTAPKAERPYEESLPDRRYRPGRWWNSDTAGWYSDEDEEQEDTDMNHFIEYSMNH